MARTVIKNVLVFDGEDISGPKTVVIEGDKIGSVSAGKEDANEKQADDDSDVVVDGTGCTLLPGLIDCYAHVNDNAQLAACAAHGVTSVCDMGGTGSDAAAAAADGPGTRLVSGAPARGTHLSGDSKIQIFVEDRVAEGADYLSVVVDDAAWRQDALEALQLEAEAKGLLTVAKASSVSCLLLLLLLLPRLPARLPPSPSP
ncbi:hypothetical protein F4780DRAFT_220487 [Xylariomycetidae sp. FL0641]|nr:hypothetical protein F4780DRAFT_220487 [Xylariomycetidae sp. FL0641]